MASPDEALPAYLGHRIPRTREEVERWVRPDEHPPKDWGLAGVASEGFWRVCEAQRRKREATEQWCAERGHSYCRTVLGWRKPAASEAAAGHVTVPGER